MIKKSRKLISYFVMSIIILFVCCQKDEIPDTSQQQTIQNAKRWFGNYDPSLEILKFTEVIDWDNAIVLDNKGEQAIEVPLKLRDNIFTNVVEDIQYNSYMRLLFIKDNNGLYQAFNIVYTTKDKSFKNHNKSFNILNIGDSYSGFITVQNTRKRIVYSGEYQNGEFLTLHNFTQKQDLTSKMVCRYYVTVGPYSTCSSWVWYPDDAFGNLPPGYMPGIGGPLFPNLPSFKIDPCETAIKISTYSKSVAFLSAKNSILQANPSIEHSITLGKDTKGNITQAPMNNGGSSIVKTTTNFPGAFVALHNHPSNGPLSAGDVYAAIGLITGNLNFNTSIILTNGATYAIVVTDFAAAQSFVKSYPADQIQGYNPEFPDAIFNQLQMLVTDFGSSVDGRTEAMAYVLDNENSGITLMKQDASGEFKPINIKRTTNSDGSQIYNSIPCN